MKVYISGPITGTEDYKERFRMAEMELRHVGHIPVNPVTISEKLGKNLPHEAYMKRDIEWLITCEGIYMLPGWENSEGAKVEKMIADACGIPEIKVKVLSKTWP